jgi:glucose/arabinose dehydrogenase
MWLFLALALGLFQPVAAGPALAQGFEIETVIQNVDLPWSLNFAPDGRLLFTSRDTGEIHALDVDTAQLTTFAPPLPVLHGGEGGLLGMVLDPDFEANNWLYVCFSVKYDGKEVNRVSRWRLDGVQLKDEAVFIEMSHALIHNGCRLVFSPDGNYLFITMGDAGNADRAQDPDSLNGKILRLKRDGSIPDDNAWPNSAVWTLGHRNAQGLAFEPGTERLWSTEHGPTTQDELNVIKKGRNYGWPLCLGEQATCPAVTNYEPAVREFYTDQTVATSDMMFYMGDAFPDWQGDLFFVTLKTGRLYHLKVSGESVVSEERLIDGEHGRLRDVTEGPDGLIYISTDARDGHAKIFRLKPVAKVFVPVVAVG